MAESKKTEKWYKSRQNNILGGVCAGLAEYTNWDLTLIRIIWALSIFFNGLGVLAYVIAFIILPFNPQNSPGKNKNQNKKNSDIIIGLILLVLGIFWISHGRLSWTFFHFPALPFVFMPFFPWRVFWPLTLIALGVLFLVFTANNRKQINDSADLNENGSENETEGFYRVREGRIFGGVCTGLSDKFNLDVSIIRIALVILAVLNYFLPLIAVYILLMIFLPEKQFPRNRG